MKGTSQVSPTLEALLLHRTKVVLESIGAQIVRVRQGPAIWVEPEASGLDEMQTGTWAWRSTTVDSSTFNKPLRGIMSGYAASNRSGSLPHPKLVPNWPTGVLNPVWRVVPYGTSDQMSGFWRALIG
jgi:hypothetical protein